MQYITVTKLSNTQPYGMKNVWKEMYIYTSSDMLSDGYTGRRKKIPQVPWKNPFNLTPDVTPAWVSYMNDP